MIVQRHPINFTILKIKDKKIISVSDVKSTNKN